MNKTGKIYDVVIIGGGVTGAAIARELSRYKLEIALLEKEAELAFGVSKSNSGIIHPGTQNPVDSLKGKLCVQGNRLMRVIAKDLGVDFKEVGELIVAFNDEDIGRLRQLKADAEQLGVPGLKIVDRDWLRVHEPNLNKEVVAALYAPTAGIISPYRLAYDLSENAARNGVGIHVDCCVTGIKAAGSHLFKIMTSRGLFETRYVINAAGLFADEVCAMVGVNDLRITPRRGQEFLLDIKKENLTNHLIFPLPTKTSKGVLVIKTADGNPMIGPTAEEINDKEDLATTDEGYKQVLSAVKRLVPSISGGDIIAYFAGLRPVADSDFIIRHEDKVPGFVTVAGIQSPGLTAAPAIALMVVDIFKKSGLKLSKKLYFYRHRKKTDHLFALPLAKIKQLIKKDEGYGDIVCRCELVSRKEIELAVERGATTLDGVKFRTRAQAGRCHGGFCTARILKILAQKTGRPLIEVTKRGEASQMVRRDRVDACAQGHVDGADSKEAKSHVCCHDIRHHAKGHKRDLVIVGAGPAGMAAALAAREAGVKDILLLERDQYPGGILNQCIHHGFGLEYFKEILTGPEYAQRFIDKVVKADGIEISLRSFVTHLTKDKVLTVLKPGQLEQIEARALIMATGCRERTREMAHIPGTRPAGIFPAGLAQKLINIEGLMPGSRVVVIGSGDIGLIMARRFTLEGAKVEAVIEIQNQTKGLVRNVVQCLKDYDIPLYFRHRVAMIHGKDRVEKIDVVKVDQEGRDIAGTRFQIPCDTVLVSVGLIPENELVEMAGVAIDKKTNTPVAQTVNATSIPGLFVCGNAFQVYDIVDSVTKDSEMAGQQAAQYLQGFKR